MCARLSKVNALNIGWAKCRALHSSPQAGHFLQSVTEGTVVQGRDFRPLHQGKFQAGMTVQNVAPV